mmetsp:Transcript_34593/g.95300  ORF Transcript_34593/g.95300 Transcript_34593/m.95300 type:complete len:125 (-) Transcript_34593:500-874(-)
MGCRCRRFFNHPLCWEYYCWCAVASSVSPPAAMVTVERPESGRRQCAGLQGSPSAYSLHVFDGHWVDKQTHAGATQPPYSAKRNIMKGKAKLASQALFCWFVFGRRASGAAQRGVTLTVAKNRK